MKAGRWSAILIGITFGTAIMGAQAPSGSTGQCRDGSYTTAVRKSGACSGHKGVQTWYAGTATAATPPVTKNAIAPGEEPMQTGAPAQTPVTSQPAQSTRATQSPAAPAQASSTGRSATRTAAPGGGPGMVWVNTSSKVYHCSGTELYGTTKNGKYMSEADAISSGARADHNKPCPK